MKGSVLIFFLSLLLIASCDQFTRRKNIPGPYYLEENEVKNWTLYYDLGNAGLGRMYNIDSIGWTNKFIFSKTDSGYYFLDKTKDIDTLNDNMIVIGPFNRDTFKKFIDSLDLKKFQFQIAFK